MTVLCFPTGSRLDPPAPAPLAVGDRVRVLAAPAGREAVGYVQMLETAAGRPQRCLVVAGGIARWHWRGELACEPAETRP